MGNQYSKIDVVNSLESTFPKIAKEWDYSKNSFKPSEVTYGSEKKVWWLCDKQHSFISSINNRTNLNRGCPYCSNKKAGYGNDLKNNHPEIVKEWDYSKNSELPEQFLPMSNKRVWWLCDKQHSYTCTIANKIKRKSGCPYCSNQKVGYGNDLANTHKNLSKEWDYSKNGFEPSEITYGSGKNVWWLCNKNHSFQKTIASRTPPQLEGCPYCSNKKVGYGNDLESTFPEIAKKWDYSKNSFEPSEITYGSLKKVWWLCDKQHSYLQRITDSTPPQNNGCPYCSNQKVGYGNDLKTNFPLIAKEWDYDKNPTRPENYTLGSDKKIWWLCSKDHSFYSKIYSRTFQNTGCPYCKLTPRSREEVYLLFELKQFFNIDENNHKIKLKRVEDVDIKLENEKVVIEYDGSYWHKDKAERDKAKTKALEKAGWTVVRVREKPLKVLSRKYNVSSKTGEYKETANKVLKKLNQLGYEVKGLDKYLERKTLVNKKEAEKYIDKLLKKKNKK